MAYQAARISHSDLGLPPNSYIYKVISTASRQDPLTYERFDLLATISSDDSLRFIDPTTLNVLPDGIIKNVNDKVTCLERGNDTPSNILATAGRDGLVKFWDKRSRKPVTTLHAPQKLISSLVCDFHKNIIAAGIENPEDGSRASPVYVWDQRNPQARLREYVESHTDTITDLQLHPNLPNLLLSASTDGLINVFNTSQSDEDEALYQVINHRSAIARAGFMYPTTDIYSMGTDETLSFYALQSQEVEKEEPSPKVYGDTREQLGCEYLAKMHWMGNDAFIAAGKHSSNDLVLYPVHKQDEPLEYVYSREQSIHLPGAHGKEIVRDILTDPHTQVTYTCGEDGSIRTWKMLSEDSMDIDDAAEPKLKIKDKKEKRKDRKKEKRKGDEESKKSRYAPY